MWKVLGIFLLKRKKSQHEINSSMTAMDLVTVKNDNSSYITINVVPEQLQLLSMPLVRIRRQSSSSCMSIHNDKLPNDGTDMSNNKNYT